jgi:predicted ABC-type transport system involved in lysophospholipase L1 biosynthesis ATPase subunit
LTIVTVTHDPAVSRRAERVVRVVDGRIDPTVADA